MEKIVAAARASTKARAPRVRRVQTERRPREVYDLGTPKPRPFLKVTPGGMYSVSACDCDRSNRAMPNLWAQDHQLQITLRMSLQDLALQGAGDSIAHLCWNDQVANLFRLEQLRQLLLPTGITDERCVLFRA